jgi:EAL domain-containing protein (putative c-di-GMP-specific phosphodiesterase class I)
VNLTASDVVDPELPLAVRNAIDLWHVEPRLLKFELTETAMLANEQVGARVMGALRELGVGTSVDDFGTGYSSVILLKTLPLDELKLDRCFVASAVQSRQDREIVRSLILLAHSLGLEVVAEGVEDRATLDLLRDFGCDRAQGYLFSRPVPAAQFLDWLKAHEPGIGVERGDSGSAAQTRE